MQTHFGRIAAGTPLQADQVQIIVGSLLGDGTLLRTTAGFCFRAHHGLGQKSLVDWKYGRLINLVRTRPRVSGTGYYFRTVTHPAFGTMRNEFYVAARKVVPVNLLRMSLTPLALAVWIMDDGSADGGQLRINTQSFTWDECQRLSALIFERFGISFTLNSDKGYPRLRCSAMSMPRLRQLVAPHLLPEMRYKLPLC